jgi:hypothetical protein
MGCCANCPIHNDTFTRSSLETLDFLSQTATSDGWTVTMASTPTAAQAGDTISGVNGADERFYYYVAAVSGDDVDIEYLYGPSGTDPGERSPEDQDIMEFDVKRLASSYATPDATGKPANYLWGITENGLVTNGDYRLEIVPVAGKSNFIAECTWQKDTANANFVLWTEAGSTTGTSPQPAGNQIDFTDSSCTDCEGSSNDRYRMFIAGRYPSASVDSTYTPTPLSGAAVTTASSATTYEITVAPGENNAIPGWTWAFQEDGVSGETASIFYYRVVYGAAEDGSGYTSPSTGGNGIVVLEYLWDTENVGARNPYGIEDDLGDQATATIFPWLNYLWNEPELAGTVRGQLADSTGLVTLRVCQQLWSRTATENQVQIIASAGPNQEIPVAITSASPFAGTNTFTSIGGSNTGLDDKVMISASKGKLIKSIKFEYNNNETGKDNCYSCLHLDCEEAKTLRWSASEDRELWDNNIRYVPGRTYGDTYSAGFAGTFDRSAKTLTLAGPSAYTPDTTSGQTFDIFGSLTMGQQASVNYFDSDGRTAAAPENFSRSVTAGGYGAYTLIEITMTRLFTLEEPLSGLTLICGDDDGTGGSINGVHYSEWPIKAGAKYRIVICEVPLAQSDETITWSHSFRILSLTDKWEYGNR